MVWQNSWGVTTRTIGVMVMVHGDDKGLVVPPRVAEVQVVIVVIPKGKDSSTALNEKAYELRDAMKRAGIRVKVDDRDNYTPGFKYNFWELRGACIRMEIGPRDMEKDQVVLVRRDDKSKAIVPMANVAESVKQALDSMQSDMFAKAKAERMVRNHPFVCVCLFRSELCSQSPGAPEESCHVGGIHEGIELSQFASGPMVSPSLHSCCNPSRLHA